LSKAVGKALAKEIKVASSLL